MMYRRLLAMLGLALVAVLLATGAASAGEQTYSLVGEYVAGENESPKEAKRRALEDAMRQAVERAGVFVTSYSETHNLVLTRDEVTVVARNMVRIVSEKYSVAMPEGQPMRATVAVVAVVNTDGMNADIEKIRQENERLKADNAALKASNDEKDQLNRDMREMREYIESLYVKGGKRWQQFHVANPTQKWQQRLNEFLNDMRYKQYGVIEVGRISAAAYGHSKQHYGNENVISSISTMYGVMSGEAMFLSGDFPHACNEFNMDLSKALHRPIPAGLKAKGAYYAEAVVLPADMLADLRRYFDVMMRWERIYGQQG